MRLKFSQCVARPLNLLKDVAPESFEINSTIRRSLRNFINLENFPAARFTEIVVPAGREGKIFALTR